MAGVKSMADDRG